VTPETLDIARRLAAHPNFRWAPGMVDDYGARVLSVATDERLVTSDLVREGSGYMTYEAHDRCRPEAMGPPDLDDDATAGVLLGVLASTGRLASVHHRHSEVGGTAGWGVDLWTRIPSGNVRQLLDVHGGPTLGHAAALALLAVWA
jgi:hypothetical protein